MTLDVPPPQTPPAIVEAGDARAFMTGSEVAEALRAHAAQPGFDSHPVFDSIPAAAFLLRPHLAKALTACGFKTSPATLATKASRGGGPPFRIFGKSAVYQWGAAVAWVLETMGEPACTTSEHRARQGAPAPQKPGPDKIAAMVEGSRRYNAARVAARKASAKEPRGPPGEAAASKTAMIKTNEARPSW